MANQQRDVIEALEQDHREVEEMFAISARADPLGARSSGLSDPTPVSGYPRGSQHNWRDPSWLPRISTEMVHRTRSTRGSRRRRSAGRRHDDFSGDIDPHRDGRGEAAQQQVGALRSLWRVLIAHNAPLGGWTRRPRSRHVIDVAARGDRETPPIRRRTRPRPRRRVTQPPQALPARAAKGPVGGSVRVLSPSARGEPPRTRAWRTRSRRPSEMV
jgi:hypothetical protein